MNRYRRNKNKGFTLAELLIVVAITIILASVGFIAIFQYQQNLKFTEMENDAREVFLAAQNSLTSMKENGVELEENNNKMVDKIGESAPSDFDEAFKNAGITGTNAEDYWKDNKNHFRYISHIAGKDVAKGSLLDQILDFGSIDETIRTDGSYIIEYDEETYTVYGVFYCDSNQVEQKQYDLSSEYAYLNTNRTDKNKRKDFGKQYNLGRLTTVGYYGTATNSDENDVKLKKPQILIYNSGKITYKEHSEKNGIISKPTNNCTNLISDVDPEIPDLKAFHVNQLEDDLKDTLSLEVINPNESGVSRIVVKVTGETSRNTQEFTYRLSNSSKNEDNWVNKDNDKFVYLHLDDLTSRGRQFGKITESKKLIPGENISVSVYFVTKNGKYSKGVTLPANSIFDSVKNEKDEEGNQIRTALVRSPRQLQNLEPRVSNINNEIFDKIDTDKEKPGIQPYMKISKVVLTGDIDWNWQNSSKQNFYKYNGTIIGEKGTKSFLSINNNELTTFDGKDPDPDNNTDHKISNLYTIQNNDGNSGLFSKITGNMEIQNLTLEKPETVSNENNAGSLIGKIGINGKEPSDVSFDVQIHDVKITDPSVSITDNGDGDAGGLVGNVENGRVVIKNVSLSVSEEGKNIVIGGIDNAGGIIGHLQSSAESSVDSVSFESGNKGLVKTKKHSAGGFIGRIDSNGLKISNSYASTYVYTAGDIDQNETTGSRAGGLIGYIDQDSNTTDISNSFYGGRTVYDTDKQLSKYLADADKITDDNAQIETGNYNIVNNGTSVQDSRHATAGGFIGSAAGNAGTIAVKDSYTTGSAFVKDGAVGGFVGQAAEDTDANQSVLVLNNTYTTGLVGSSSDSSEKGSFTGRHPLNSSSSNNSYLDGINSDINAVGDDNNVSNTVIKAVAGGNEPFNGGSVTADNTHPYLNELKGKAYPFTAEAYTDNTKTSFVHFGDWPDAPKPDNKAKDEVGFIYYEKIAGDNNTYYNGYFGSLSDDTANNIYTPIQTASGTAPDENNAGFRDAKGIHVIEDGYVLLVKNTIESFKIGLVGENNYNYRNQIYPNNKDSVVQLSDDFVNSLKLKTLNPEDIKNYKAYLINDTYVSNFWTNQPDRRGELLSVYQGEDYTENNGKTKNEALFRFNPLFADTVNTASMGHAENIINKDDSSKDAADYIVRSARQYNLLSSTAGEAYLNNNYATNFKIQQRLDIDFNEEFSNHQTLPAQGNQNLADPNSGSNSTISNIGDKTTYYGAVYNNQNVSLNHMDHTFVKTLQYGTVHNLDFNDFNNNSSYQKGASLIASGGGIINNINVNNSSFTGVLFNIDSGNDGSRTFSVTNINLKNVAAVSVFDQITGSVSNINATNIHMTGNGLINSNMSYKNPDISNIHFVNATIGGDGITTGLSGTYKNISIVNAQIGKNGFAETVNDWANGANKVTVDGVSIYGDKTLYLANKNDVYYKPNPATVDPSVFDDERLYGYNLVTIGVVNNTSNIITGNHSGFMNEISRNSEVKNSSVTGKVFGDNAAGFVYSVNDDNTQITNCYANTIISSKGSSAGFANTVNGKINSSHALGILNSNSGAGFSVNTSSGKITNSYSAVWKISGMNSGNYLPFSNSGSKDNNYVMEFTDGMGNYNWDTADILSANKITSKDLKKNDNLGLGVSIKGETYKYYQYAVAGDYPYPMPLITSLNTTEEKTLDHYGDWYDPDNQNILANPHKVQFFDEDGTPLTDELSVGDSASVSGQIPSVNAPDGKMFVGWYNNNNDFSDTNKISDETFNSVRTDIKAYAHYVTEDGYVELHYVNPTNNAVRSLGQVKLEGNTLAEPDNIRRFGSYTRDDTWNAKADGTGTSYNVSGDAIQNVGNDIKDLYLRYHKAETVNITLEIRADNENKTYPLIYQSYIHEFAKGQTYDFTQGLNDFENANKDSSYSIENNGLRKRDLTRTDSIILNQVNTDEASLNTTNKSVELKGTADTDKTYVVLYTGKTVSYQIRHIFKNSKGKNGQNEVELPANIKDKLGYANSMMNYSPNASDTFTVVENRQGSLGEYIDLEKEIYTTSDDSDSGYDVVLNPDNNFVLNQDHQQYTVNYSRKKYQLTIDTDGAEVVTNSPVSVPFGADISATSSYLNGIPKNQRKGFTLNNANKWSYKTTAEGTDVNNGGIMPAADTTATANWVENTTAPYTVEVWMQKVDASQTPTTEDKDKEYDYYNSFTVDANDRNYNPGVNGVPGFLNDANTTNTLVNSKISNATNDLKYFSVNTNNAVLRNDTDGNNEVNSGTVTIRSDGTTVYRVFYDRKTITFSFDYGQFKTQNTSQQLYIRRIQDTDWFGNPYYSYSLTTDPSQRYDYATRNNVQTYTWGFSSYYIYNDPQRGWDILNGYSNSTDNWGTGQDVDGNSIETLIRTQTGAPVTENYNGLYGQKFTAAEELFQQYVWFERDYSNRSLGSLMDYILPGGDHDQNNEVALTLICNGMNYGTDVMNHYQEDLNGNWVLKTTTKTNLSGTIISSDKYDGFTYYGYTWGANQANTISKDKVSINTATSFPDNPRETTLNFYHKRNTNNITLMNVNAMSNAKLSDGFSVDGNNNINVKFEQPLKDIGLPTDAATMNQYIPASVDQNGETKGYTFGGWYTSATFAEGTELKESDIMPNHNIRLYAKWIGPTYTVKYMDGNNEITEEKVNRYDTITLNDDQSVRNTGYVKDGSTFVGWYTDPDLADNHEYLTSRAVTGDLTLYAKYEKAAGTDVTYNVEYVYEGKTKAADTRTVKAKIGDSYDERPRDIPNAVSLDVRHSGKVTEDMDGTTITFRYRKYAGSDWNYTVENRVVYTDLDNQENTLEASLNSGKQSTTNTSKTVYADNINGYLIQGDSSKTVNKDNNKVAFDYRPDYDSLNADNVSVIYGDSKNPVLSGTDDWMKPDGWKFETRAVYRNSSGVTIDKPTDAGTYKVDLSLYLVNDNQSMRLYTRKNVTYRVMKRSITLTSTSDTWKDDGKEHSNHQVSAEPEWVNGDGATYDFSGSTIQDVGSIRNEFTVVPTGSTSLDNYNVYRVFGTLTVTPAQ